MADLHMRRAASTRDAVLRSILSNPDALLWLARAYDGEDAAQMGEANPHDVDRDAPTFAEFQKDRIACAKAAVEAMIGQPVQVKSCAYELAEASGKLHDLMCLPEAEQTDQSLSIAKQWAREARDIIQTVRLSLLGGVDG